MFFKISSLFNWILTLGWLVIVGILWFFQSFDKPTTLNELGDFIAGAFAPLAFFWLVRGFYQQGKGLEQNSKALKLQAKELKASTDALNLQAQELKRSVNEQKNLILIQEQEQASKHFSVEPSLTYSGGEFRVDTDQYDPSEEYPDLQDVVVVRRGKYSLLISNQGELARKFVLIDPYTDRIEKNQFEISKSKKCSFMFNLSQEETDELISSNKFISYFHVLYYDIYGKPFSYTIRVKISKDYEDNYFYVSVDKYAYKKDVSELPQS